MIKNIDVVKGFQSSINIAYDLNDNEKVRGFIPTLSSLEVMEDVLLSVAPTSLQGRARVLIGAYGRGKSHIVLVLLSMLFKKDVSLFAALLAKMEETNPQLCEFAKGYIESGQKLLPVVVRGSSSSLTQSFLNALQQTLNEEGLSDIMPETHFQAAVKAINYWREHYVDTYSEFTKLVDEPIDGYILALKEYSVNAYEKFIELYPSLTAGSTFNPFIGFDIVELYENVVDKIKEKGYSGIYVIYDEFSKYLESSIANATINDIKLLQDFAEKCDRSGTKQMHLMLICHKDIANYIDTGLPKEKVDGWRGVSGRFKHINLQDNFSQMYEIVSAVIRKDALFWNKFCTQNKTRFDDLARQFSANRLLDSTDKDEVLRIITGCYPLHPISTFILPRVSEKVAQNERTLFTFLSANEKHTLPAFLKIAEGDFPLLTPDYIYDYFETLFRKEPYNSETHKMYKVAASVLRKVNSKSLGAKIIKTIALIYIVGQYERIAPVYDVIVDAFRYQVDDVKQISDALTDLIEKECIVYQRRSNNYLKLKESSGVEIPGEIVKYIEKNRAVLDAKKILNDAAFDSYMYPTRYNDEFEITRYFELKFIYGAELLAINDWGAMIENTTADGVIYAIIPSNDAEIEDVISALSKTQSFHERIIFVVPKKYRDIEQIALEYNAVKNLRALAIGDDLLFDEYDVYIEDLTEVISSFIYSYTRPESGGADYYYNGNKQSLYRKAQMSALLSDICEQIFSRTPIINNESINKNILPTVAINSRTKLLHGLLEDDLMPNLGLTGTGQDVSIMRSTLIQTGILLHCGTSPTIDISPEDVNVRGMLETINTFFIESGLSNETSFSVLYDRLTKHKNHIGLKRGVIPIYIAVALRPIKKGITVKSGEREERITPSLLNDINGNPDAYSVFYEDWNAEKAEYLTGLEEIFGGSIVEREKKYNSYTYVVNAMCRWYMALPKYAKELESAYMGVSSKDPYKPLPKVQRRFINSLKQPEINPREYLFEKVSSIFEMSDLNLSVIDNIRSTKNVYDNALTHLKDVLIGDVKTIFGTGGAIQSLTSSIKDWYESLSDATLQYLFTNNETRVLELMQTITNDEDSFIQRLGKATTGLRIDDWSDKTIETFLTELVSFKKLVEEHNVRETSGFITGANMYKIVFADAEGNEVVKSFSKTEYSSRAKLLLNEITTSLEEMGQSITEQEKRQVLMELLERLC